MKVLLDTHILLWAAAQPERLPQGARDILENTDTEPLFSPASLWEIAIKRSLDRADFRVDPRLVRRALIDNGYGELPITSEHAVALMALPALHKDPFDRMLVAQATQTGIELVTADETVARYPGPIRRV